MMGVEAITDLISRGADFYRHYVPPEWNAYPNVAAAGALIVGIALAFWGARVLRTIYVLAFLVAGAAGGFLLGRRYQIDPLIGLTFGGGVAALLGYVFFRWWVGMTAGALAVLVVTLVASARLSEVHQEYRDHLAGVGTGGYANVWSAGSESPASVAGGLIHYLANDRRDFGARLAVASSLAWLLGMAMGMLLTRFTVVVGTSVFGVLLLSAGGGVVMWRHLPNLWGFLAGYPQWCLVAPLVLLIAAIWSQVRPEPKKAAPAPASPPAPPVAAPAK